jgi:hypothetical protein
LISSNFQLIGALAPGQEATLMATPKTANGDPGIVTGLFYDRDSAERAYRSIVSRGYDKDEINLAMADETRKVLFPEDGLVTDLGEKAAKEGVDLGNPKGGTLATLATAVSAIGAAGALLLLPGVGVVFAGPVAAAIAGAAAAGLAGGLIGAFQHWGIPSSRMDEYRAGIENGGILMGVKPHSAEDARYFEQQWKVHHASQVHV